MGYIINPYSYATGVAFENIYSMAFDGIDDYINCGTISALNGGISAFSISLWINYSGSLASDMLISGGISSSDDFYVQLTSATNLRYASGSQFDDITISSISAGSWYNIVSVHNGTNVDIYLNGVLQGSATTQAPTSNLGTNIILADYLLVGSGYNYAGNLDEISIFNSALSSSDITSIYNSGAPSDLSSLNPTAWYRMGDSASYKSPQYLLPENSNKDKLSNFSFNFDGVDDEISLGSLQINTDAAWSVSFWANLTAFSASYPGVFKLKTDESQGFACFFSETGSYKGINFGANTAPFVNIKTDGDISASLVGAWNNIILTYNGSGKTTLGNYSIYVNGSAVTAVASGAYGTITNVSVLGDVTQHFNGNIDEFAVFQGTELTSGNATSIYNGGVPTTLPVTPIAHYKMGEEANFTDNWLVNNSALNNYSTRSFNFDGVDDLFSYPEITFLKGGGSYFSISMWVKVNTSTQRGFWCCRSATPDNIDFYINTLGKLILYLKSSVSGNIIATSTSALSNDTWTHIGATFDGTEAEADRIKLYVNGSAFASSSTGTGANLPNGAVTNLNYIGSTWQGIKMLGNIDETAIWNSTLSAANMTSIYNSGTPTTLPITPVAYWKMGEDATFSTNWTVPDGVGSFDATSANMDLADLEGEAPNYTGGGLSANMTIEDRVGEAPNSSSNSLSYNMDEADREEETP